MFATDNEQMWIIKVALFLKTFIFLNFFLEGGGVSFFVCLFFA